MFVDVNNNESILDQLSISFIYDDLGSGIDTMKRLVQEVSSFLSAEFKQVKPEGVAQW